ncbi:hypoxanthine phosphoribosyltransferase [Caldicellulosiruptoraceae bacterium PP1]
MTDIKNKVKEILITEQQLKDKVIELGKQISEDYKNSDDFLMVCILKGGVIFMADLIRAVDVPVKIEFMAVSSYGNSTSSSGIVRIMKDLDTSIEGKDVLLVEDIVDTGLTLKYIKEYLLARKPKSLKICTMLDKPSRRKVQVDVDYKGFEIPDKFVIGYGLDYAGLYRNLPYIGVLE